VFVTYNKCLSYIGEEVFKNSQCLSHIASVKKTASVRPGMLS